jgi:DNA-binding PadR family transcriptional regulator
MSRGMGVLQRQMLERLAPLGPGEVPGSRAQSTHDLARLVFKRAWGASVSPAERASVCRALNTLQRSGLLEVQRQVRQGRSVAVWHLADKAWRQAEKLRQQQAGAARRENGRRRQEQRDGKAKPARKPTKRTRRKRAQRHPESRPNGSRSCSACWAATMPAREPRRRPKSRKNSAASG